MEISTWRARTLGLAGVLACVAVACLPKLTNDFVWDDIPFIVESDRLFDAHNLSRIFWTDTMYVVDGGKFQARAGLDTYRPVSVASFFFDAWLSGRRPLGYHLDNLFAHLACVALVYAWSIRLLGADAHRRALWAAAFFGLHPVLAEAHIWINGRSDVYCTLFGLAGALCWTAAKDAARPTARLVLAGVLFLVGLLSKESLAPFLVMLLLWDVGIFHHDPRQLRVTPALGMRALPVVGAIGTYTLLRWHALSGLHTNAGHDQLLLALSRGPMLMLDGLRSSLAPRQVMPRYLHEEYSRLSVAMLSLSWMLVLLAAVFVALRGRRWPVTAFGLGTFVAVLAPASLIATMAWYGLGRYLYLPIAVLAPGLADAGTRLMSVVEQRSQRAALLCRVASVAYLAVFGVRLFASTWSWDGPLAFYESIIAEAPEASHGHGGLGKYLLERGALPRGTRELELAVQLAPLDSRYLNNLGVAYLRSGRRAEAQRAAELGIQRFPREAAKFANLRTLVEARP